MALYLLGHFVHRLLGLCLHDSINSWLIVRLASPSFRMISTWHLNVNDWDCWRDFWIIRLLCCLWNIRYRLEVYS